MEIIVRYKEKSFFMLNAMNPRTFEAVCVITIMKYSIAKTQCGILILMLLRNISKISL